MARVWPGVFVTDDVLHRAVRELRRLFDDGTEQPGVIETIRKRGYRLIAPIERRRASPPRRPTPRRCTGSSADRDLESRARWRSCRRCSSPRSLAGVAGILGFGIGRPASVDTEARVRFTPFTSEPGNEVDPGAVGVGPPRLRGPRRRRARAPLHQAVAGRAARPDHARAPIASTRRSGRPMKRSSRSSSAAIAACTVRDRLGRRQPRTRPDAVRIARRAPDVVVARRPLARDDRRGRHVRVACPHRDRRPSPTASARALTDPPAAHIGDTSPAFSPDGRQIAFVRSISGGLGDVFVTVGRRRHAGARDLRQRRRARRRLGAGRPASRLLLRPQRRHQPVARAGRRRRAGAPRRRRRQGQAPEHRQARRIDCLRRLALRDQPDGRRRRRAR